MKHRLSYWIVLTPVVLALCGSADAWATECEGCGTTVLGGPVVGETWTAANSPYCVTGDLFISNLTIEPGVCVRIDGPQRLNIQTIIHADGKADQPIIFTAKDPGASRWKGMEFVQTVPGSVLRHCRFSYASDSAIRLVNTAPTIDKCTFVNNQAPGHGGAVNAAMTSETMRITGSTFSENRNNMPVSSGSRFGGAIYVTGPAELVECVFTGNHSHARNCSFADFMGAGGGVYSGSGDLEIAGCLFTENVVTITDCACCNTVRTRGANLYIAGGAGNITIANSVFSAGVLGSADHRSGGGIYVESGDVTLTNVTIARNERAGLHRGGGNVSVINSILFFNNNSNAQIIGDVCVDYSTVQNGFPGECGDNNIVFNPAFAGTGTTLCDLTIIEFSPVIDAGDPDPAFNDDTGDCNGPPFGKEQNDMGAHGGPGARWTVPPNPFCTRDLGCDGVIGAHDLAIVLGNWGPCPEGCDCPADLDDNGDVGPFDLALILGFWGPCEP